jgi:hypothetical protein
VHSAAASALEVFLRRGSVVPGQGRRPERGVPAR